jgi:hypothetical protein
MDGWIEKVTKEGIEGSYMTTTALLHSVIKN